MIHTGAEEVFAMKKDLDLEVQTLLLAGARVQNGIADKLMNFFDEVFFLTLLIVLAFLLFH